MEGQKDYSWPRAFVNRPVFQKLVGLEGLDLLPCVWDLFALEAYRSEIWLYGRDENSPRWYTSVPKPQEQS